jgi:hypothetical protein
MGAKAVRHHDSLKRHGAPRWRHAVRVALGALLGALLNTDAAAQETTFDDGPTLADRLLAGVVRVHADEHGFGVVVGADDTFVYIATARHVVGPSAAIVVHGCLEALPQGMAAERLRGVDAAEEDLALLRVPRPRDYRVAVRALAPTARVAVRDPAWLLGRDDVCAVLPRSGAVAARPDARAAWRIDMPGVLGGSSGAPVATGRGIVGITTDSDNANITALDIEQIARRVRAGGGRFDLVDARNEPPNDPQAAELALAEMLDALMRELRDAQTVLRQPTVKREYFVRTVTEYNQAAERFLAMKDKYAGTLARHWEPEVATQWLALRDRLQAVHRDFLSVNSQAREVVETERVPKAVRDRMEVLDPELDALEGAIAQFLRSLSQRRVVNASPPT